MNIIEMIIAIALIGLGVGLLLYVVGDKMPEFFKRAIYALSILLVVIILLQAFGLMPHLGALRVR